MSRSKIVTVLSLILISGSILAKGPAPRKETVAQDPKIADIALLPVSRIQISGDSTMKKFSASTSLIELKGEAKEEPSLNGILPWSPLKVEMLLNIEDLKSGDDLLDKHMHENLRAEKYPKIQLSLSSFYFYKMEENKPATVAASGTLTVAGVTKPIELVATIAIEGNEVRINGSKMILMSEFGIEPPTMMLGTLKTKDQIEISYDVKFLINGDKKE